LAVANSTLDLNKQDIYRPLPSLRVIVFWFHILLGGITCFLDAGILHSVVRLFVCVCVCVCVFEEGTREFSICWSVGLSFFFCIV